MSSALDTSDDQRDAGDQSVVGELKDVSLTEADTDTRNLRDVREALERINRGEFGLCTVDGQPIEEKRLQAVPWTKYCREHQEQLEAAEDVRTPAM